MQHQQQPADTAQTTAADAVPDENSAPVEEQLSKKPFATLMRVMRKAKADELEFQRKAAAALKQQTNQEVEQEHKEKHARMGPFQSIATLMRRKKNAPAPAAEPPSASLETAAEAVSSSSKETQDAVVPHSDVVVHDGAPIEAEPLNAAAAEFIPAHVSDAPKEPAILASSIPLEAAQPLALDSEPLPLTETAPDRDTLEPAPVPEFQDETATTTEAQTGDDHPELTLESHEKPAAIAETPTEQAEAEKSVEESNGEGSATTGSELNSKVEDEAKRKSAFSTLMRRFQKPKKPETTQEAGSQTAEIEEAETQEVSTQAAAGTLDAETQFVEPAQPEPFEKDIEKPAKQNRFSFNLPKFDLQKEAPISIEPEASAATDSSVLSQVPKQEIRFMPAKDQGKFGAKNRARFSEMFRKMTSRPAEREVVTPDIVHESENVMIEESSLPNSAAVAPTAEQVLASAREAENHGDIDITEEEITQMQDAENRDQVVVQENRDQIIVSPHGKEEIISNVALNQEAEASLAAQESSKTIPDENTLEDTSDLEIGKVSTTDSAAMAAADGNEMPVLTKEGKSVRAKIRQFFKKTNNRNQPSEV